MHLMYVEVSTQLSDQPHTMRDQLHGTRLPQALEIVGQFLADFGAADPDRQTFLDFYNKHSSNNDLHTQPTTTAARTNQRKRKAKKKNKRN